MLDEGADGVVDGGGGVGAGEEGCARAEGLGMGVSGMSCGVDGGGGGGAYGDEGAAEEGGHGGGGGESGGGGERSGG